MRIHLSAAMIVVSSMLWTQAAVWGQGRTLFGSGGGLGGGVTAGARSFGGGSPLGSSTPGGMLEQQARNIGQAAGLQQLMQASRQRGAFVGSSATEMQSQGFAGSVQAGQNVGGQGSAMSSLGPTRTNRSRGPGGAARRQRGTTQIRASLRMGFSRPVLAPSRVSIALSQRLSNYVSVQAVSPVEVVIQGRTATLRGVVATNYARALAEQLARLEAGIGQVRNEIVVAVAPAEPALRVPDEPAAVPPAARDAVPPAARDAVPPPVVP